MSKLPFYPLSSVQTVQPLARFRPSFPEDAACENTGKIIAYSSDLSSRERLFPIYVHVSTTNVDG